MKISWFFSFAFIFLLTITTKSNAQISVDILGSLPELIPESSGLLFYKGKLITHNDSGNAAELYVLDTTSLEVTRTVKILNATNVDWEDLAQDEEFIYIGDIGNNRGGRQDLAIYKISKALFEVQDEVEAELIFYKYEDQTDFSENSNSDWDAEAMIVIQDSLVIFTKQWVSQNTNVYVLPKQAGDFKAFKRGAYNIGGLITGATYDVNTDCAFLVGYSPRLQPFLITIKDPLATAGESEEIKKDFLSIGTAQIEGIALVDLKNIFLTSENFQNSNPPIALQAQLLKINTEAGTKEDVLPLVESARDTLIKTTEHTLYIYKSEREKNIRYDLLTQSRVYGRAIYDAMGRRVHFNESSNIENNQIDLASLEGAVYYLTIYLQDAIISEPFILK